MTTSIKITELTNIGANISYTSLVPVVNMIGTPETQKANLQIVGNLILSGAGGANFPRAAQATLALSVANSNQPNITSIGNGTSVTANGNVTVTGNITGNYFIGNGSLLTGLTTVQGLQGLQGVQGIVGNAGPTGIQGLTGSGIQGLTGAQGLIGSQGLQGSIGLQGIQGINGNDGIQGITGIGIQGVQGIQGITGTGIQGITGPNGIQGIQGLSGSGGTSSQIANGNSTVDIASANGNVTVNVSGANSWTFGTDGVLTTSGTAAISPISNNFNILTTDTSGAVQFFTDYGNTNFNWIFDGYGYTYLPNTFGYSNTAVIAQVNAGNIIIETGAGPAKAFTFGDDGDLTLPGNLIGNTNGFAIGYLDIPQVVASNTTLALTDAGKHYYSTTAGNLTLTIPNNATTSFTTGTAISIVVQAAGNILVNAASGVTLYMAGNSTAANRVVSTYGMATLLKVANDTWFINGTGVS